MKDNKVVMAMPSEEQIDLPSERGTPRSNLSFPPSDGRGEQHG